MSRSASARWRAPPATNSASLMAARAARLRPSAPSSPIPTKVSQGAIGRRPVVSFGANQRSPARVRAGSDPRRNGGGGSIGPRPCGRAGCRSDAFATPAGPARPRRCRSRPASAGSAASTAWSVSARQPDGRDHRCDAPVRRTDVTATRPKRPRARRACRCWRSCARRGSRSRATVGRRWPTCRKLPPHSAASRGACC